VFAQTPIQIDIKAMVVAPCGYNCMGILGLVMWRARCFLRRPGWWGCPMLVAVVSLPAIASDHLERELEKHHACAWNTYQGAMLRMGKRRAFSS